MSSVQRKNKQGVKLTVSCPSAVTDYNIHMGGVDKHDMRKQQYGLDRKSKKWWHRPFFGVFDMAVVSSYVVYADSQENNKCLAKFDYYREIATGLLTYSTKTARGVKRRRIDCSSPESVRLSNVGVHIPAFVKEKNC